MCNRRHGKSLLDQCWSRPMILLDQRELSIIFWTILYWHMSINNIINTKCHNEPVEGCPKIACINIPCFRMCSECLVLVLDLNRRLNLLGHIHRGIDMMTSSNGNIFRVTGPLCGEFTGPGEFPTQRPVTRSFDVFFDLRLNKRLNKQSWGWWFETPSCSLWRQCNVYDNSDPFHRQIFASPCR